MSDLPKMDSALKELAKLAVDQGWTVQLTKTGRLEWIPKDKSQPSTAIQNPAAP